MSAPPSTMQPKITPIVMPSQPEPLRIKNTKTIENQIEKSTSASNEKTAGKRHTHLLESDALVAIGGGGVGSVLLLIFRFLTLQ